MNNNVTGQNTETGTLMRVRPLEVNDERIIGQEKKTSYKVQCLLSIVVGLKPVSNELRKLAT